MPKQRNHNEWFRHVLLGGRKSCPTCRQPLAAGEMIWSWGEYVNAKFRLIRHCCKACWPKVASALTSHTKGCGCTVALCSASGSGPLPDWMKLPEGCKT